MVRSERGFVGGGSWPGPIMDGLMMRRFGGACQKKGKRPVLWWTGRSTTGSERQIAVLIWVSTSAIRRQA
jgi:hypothetical protein